MQFDWLGHRTAERCLEVAPGGFGLRSAVHRLPSQRWMSMRFWSATSCVPTATHAFGVGHATAARLPYCALVAVGPTVQRDGNLAAPAGATATKPSTVATAQSTAAIPIVVMR
jgi:hypothetical protein